QVGRLARASHQRPGRVVCVMELASMLAGEPFRDHPASVCPVIAALLRSYNDRVDRRRRRDLYRFASDCVGTRAMPERLADYALQRDRASHAIAWARTLRRRRPWLQRVFSKKAPVPEPTASPSAIGKYVAEAVRRRSDSAHAQMLELIDRLIGLTPHHLPDLREFPVRELEPIGRSFDA